MGFYATSLSSITSGAKEEVYPPHRAKMHPPSKNRVWDFLEPSPICARQFASQPLALHREKRPTPTIIVSGVRYYGYRYLHPELGRWMSRDPIGERGGAQYEKSDIASEQSWNPLYDMTQVQPSLYAFVDNSPLSYVDHLGLAIWKCSRKTNFKIGNHVYLWNDTKGESCGTGGSSGGKGTTDPSDQGPPPGKNGKGGDSCIKISESNGKEDEVMACCKKTANDGTYCPGLNDCHNAADDCLKNSCLLSPPMWRFGPPAAKPPTFYPRPPEPVFPRPRNWASL